MNLYEILEVGKEATDDELKRNYRRLAMKCHPDRNNGDDSKFIEITQAYEVLSDPERRKDYDATGNTKLNSNESAVFGLIIKCFYEVLAQVTNPDKIDMIQMIRNNLKPKREVHEENILANQRGIDQLKKIIGRFKTPEGTINFLEEQMQVTIRKNEEEIVRIKREQIELIDKALELLDTMEYQFNKESPRTYPTMSFWEMLPGGLHIPHPQSKLKPEKPVLETPIRTPDDDDDDYDSDIDDSDLEDK
jgi:curved DNA-binding protein CbpA